MRVPCRKRDRNDFSYLVECQTFELHFKMYTLFIKTFLADNKTSPRVAGRITSPRATEITSHDNDRNYYVNESTTHQGTVERNNNDIMNGSFNNLIKRNWLLITILLVLLACIVLSVTYSSPIFIRIQEMFVRIGNIFHS